MSLRYCTHMNDDQLAIVVAQHGLISRQQALAAKMSPGEWGALVRSKDWKRLVRGVYRSAAARPTWEQTLMAGCLATGGVASHQAAGTLWKLPQIGPHLELIVPAKRRIALSGFTIHRTGPLDDIDQRTIQGIPVTSLARTVLDCSLQAPDKALDLVTHVLAKRKVPLSLLQERLKAMGAHGGDEGTPLAALLGDLAGRKRHVDSSLQRALEQIALEAYRAGLLPQPVFEHPVQLADGSWRYPDVAYPDVQIGFEAVSYEFHSLPEPFAADQERNLDLLAEGWVIVPLTERQIGSPKRLVVTMGRIIANQGPRRAPASRG
jgi:hypothetical protein